MPHRFASSALALALPLLAGLLVSGCSGSFSLGLTDAPVDGVSSVVLEFTTIEAHSVSTDKTVQFPLNPPRQIELLSLSGGTTTLLVDQQALPAGDYDWLRLSVNEADSHVVTNAGAQVGVQIPSDAVSGLTVNQNFSVKKLGAFSFVIDFNLRQSLHLPDSAGQPYLLRPVLRMVDTTASGDITGNVGANLVNASACTDLTFSNGTEGGVVYVYSGTGVTPVDIDSAAANQPVTTAPVRAVNGIWQYTAAFLEPGVYTVAFTCQSSSDALDTTDNIAFQNAANVTVTNGQSETHDFP